MKVNLFYSATIISFSVKNKIYCQLDFTMTAKAFIFRCLDKFVDVPLGNGPTNKKLFNFYVKQLRTHYEIWSLKRIGGLMIGKPFEAEGFTNVSFKGFIGSYHKAYVFTLVDLLQMNPYDWIVLLNIVLKDPVNYEPIFQILRMMIQGNI